MRALGLIGILVALLTVGVLAKRQLSALTVAAPLPSVVGDSRGPAAPSQGDPAAASPPSPQAARNLPAQVQSQVEAAQEEASRKLRAAADSGSP
jgi:hypothetical protein